jgi:hypothetical protein
VCSVASSDSAVSGLDAPFEDRPVFRGGDDLFDRAAPFRRTRSASSAPNSTRSVAR